MKLALLIWEDASEADDGPWADRNAKPAEAIIFHQVGYIYSLTSEAIELTYCVGEHQMAPRTRVPIGMVRKLVELHEGEPVKIPKKRKKA